MQEELKREHMRILAGRQYRQCSRSCEQVGTVWAPGKQGDPHINCEKNARTVLVRA